MDVADKIGEKWGSSQKVLVAFGAPSRGLHEIVQDEGSKPHRHCGFYCEHGSKSGNSNGENGRSPVGILSHLEHAI